MNPRNTTVYHRDLNHAVSGLLFQTYAGVAKHLINNGININLPLETIDGDRVRIIAIDTDHRYGLVGEVIDHTTDPATCWLARWDMAGNYCGTTAAVEKHSIRQNSPMPAAAEPPRPTVATHIDEFVGEVRAPVEPVHDHGLEEEERSHDFAAAFEAALAGPKVSPVDATDNEAIIRHAKDVLGRKHNISPPKPLTPAQVAFANMIARRYNSKPPIVRAYAIVGLNAALGRFCWYSLDKAGDFPPDHEIEVAAEVLSETRVPFYAIVSPRVRTLLFLGADPDGQRFNVASARHQMVPHAAVIDVVLKRHGAVSGLAQ